MIFGLGFWISEITKSFKAIGKIYVEAAEAGSLVCSHDNQNVLRKMSF